MKLAVIIATLVLAVSTAGAQPPVWSDQHDDWREQYDARQSPMWIRLSPSLPSFRERQEIYVAPNAGLFRSVRLTADTGNLLVKRVNIRFRSGRLQQVVLNRFLRAGETVNIPLVNGVHRIDRVVVLTERGPGYRTNGRFSVYGARSVPQYGIYRDRRPIYRY